MTDTPLDIGVLGYRFMRNHLFQRRLSSLTPFAAGRAWRLRRHVVRLRALARNRLLEKRGRKRLLASLWLARSTEEAL
jgi:hypothetical protein